MQLLLLFLARICLRGSDQLNCIVKVVLIILVVSAIILHLVLRVLAWWLGLATELGLTGLELVDLSLI